MVKKKVVLFFALFAIFVLLLLIIQLLVISRSTGLFVSEEQKEGQFRIVSVEKEKDDDQLILTYTLENKEAEIIPLSVTFYVFDNQNKFISEENKQISLGAIQTSVFVSSFPISYENDATAILSIASSKETHATSIQLGTVSSSSNFRFGKVALYTLVGLFGAGIILFLFQSLIEKKKALNSLRDRIDRRLVPIDLGDNR